MGFHFSAAGTFATIRIRALPKRSMSAQVSEPASVAQSATTIRSPSSCLRAKAIKALEEKLAEAEELRIEIEKLRKLAAAPGPDVRLRVRIIEASLDKIKQLGLSWPPTRRADATEIEEHLATLLADRRPAKLVTVETLSVGEGTEGRVRVGAEFPADLLA